MNRHDALLNKQYDLGKANLDVKQVVAGSIIDCSLKFTVGDHGISKNGSIKILFRAISDCGIPQFSDAHRPNYVTISSTNRTAQLIPENSTTGLQHKLHERPWWNGFILNISKAELAPRDHILVQFNHWQQQTFIENKFQLKLFIDPFGLGRFIELSENPAIKIVPNQPHKLVMIAPTSPIQCRSFVFLIKLLDKFGNLCEHHKSQITLSNTRNIFCPKKINLHEDRVLIKISTHSKGHFTILGEWNGRVWESNPILPIANPSPRSFWADLHWQSEEMAGVDELRRSFKFAQNIGFLDVTSHQGNDFQITKSFWHSIETLCQQQTVPNKHLAFLGFEWSGNSANGGDHNVIFLNDKAIINRSSHGLLSNQSDIKTDTTNINALFAQLKNKQALVIAHTGGRIANLNFHNPKLQRLVEIHSCWGTNEQLLFDALRKKLRVGVVANSDGHTNRPGAEIPGNSRMFPSNGGLTCILSRKLNKKSIFTALQQRHCYGTTGARIILQVTVSNKSGKSWIMGDKIPQSGNSQLTMSINCIGTDNVSIIEIFDNDQVVKQLRKSSSMNARRFFTSMVLPIDKIGYHAFFVKITQINQEMAWSSPIYV